MAIKKKPVSKKASKSTCHTPDKKKKKKKVMLASGMSNGKKNKG